MLTENIFTNITGDPAIDRVAALSAPIFQQFEWKTVYARTEDGVPDVEDIAYWLVYLRDEVSTRLAEHDYAGVEGDRQYAYVESGRFRVAIDDTYGDRSVEYLLQLDQRYASDNIVL